MAKTKGYNFQFEPETKTTFGSSCHYLVKILAKWTLV